MGAVVSKPEGAQQLPGTSSYFRGGDFSKWRTGIPQFGKVQYRGVYPGIDVVYYGNQGTLEYDFQIAPGADPSKIRIGYAGASHMRIDNRGDLILSTKTGDIVQKRVRSFIRNKGRRAHRYRRGKSTSWQRAQDGHVEDCRLRSQPGTGGGSGVEVCDVFRRPWRRRCVEGEAGRNRQSVHCSCAWPCRRPIPIRFL